MQNAILYQGSFWVVGPRFGSSGAFRITPSYRGADSVNVGVASVQVSFCPFPEQGFLLISSFQIFPSCGRPPSMYHAYYIFHAKVWSRDSVILRTCFANREIKTAPTYRSIMHTPQIFRTLLQRRCCCPCWCSYLKAALTSHAPGFVLRYRLLCEPQIGTATLLPPSLHPFLLSLPSLDRCGTWASLSWPGLQRRSAEAMWTRSPCLCPGCFGTATIGTRSSPAWEACGLSWLITTPSTLNPPWC